MDIVIIGSGNVAAVLGRAFKAAGHIILQVYSRNASAASALAYEWDTESTNYKSLLNTQAAVYILAVPDDAIPDVVSNLRLPGKIVAHTAASVPMDILQNVTNHYGIFYPLQSLRKEMSYLPDIPVFFDGHDAKAKKVLSELAHSIAGKNVTEASDEDRLKLHVAAVFVSNFTNHLYALAEEYCKKEGLDFKQLVPLILETAKRTAGMVPAESQTGPAMRNDTDTLLKHMELLKAHPRHLEIYKVFTESIRQMHS